MVNITVIWFVIGVLLLLSEFLIPGFTIFFFGVGAIIVSLLLLLITPLQNVIWLQITLFTISSVLFLIFLRKHFTKTLKGDIFKEKDDYIGEECLVIESTTLKKPGRIRFQGTTWTAESQKHSFKKNSKAKIIGKKENDAMIFIIDKLHNEEK